ncbi:restriction endonuclease subunit S [Flavobacterium celericrescens]|uniref:Restriction endonuclease subunit S n=1 Tax=Flavobacterium celericrescens TaxID=2709780 RepID=A0ABX0IGF0_9FLAO|nr:restriction endonuclease subunit S [Flavobacterium celericrescens]NHM05443.1 restriction endonuclease subunit S [Flavobacterium celericrescens]
MIKSNVNNPRLRFPNFKDDWKKFQLKDVLVEHKSRNSKSEFDEVFSVAKEKGVINQIEHLGRSYASDNITNYKVVFPDDVIYTKSPTAGFPFGIIKQNKIDRTGVVSVLYAVFKPQNKYLGLLLDYYFSLPVNTYNYLVPLVHKGAKNTMNIGNEDFLKGAKISFPSEVLEQQKITDFFISIDKRIEQLKEKKELLEQYKKGITQKIFSQELRFKDEEGKDFPDWTFLKLKDVFAIKSIKNKNSLIQNVLTNSATRGIVSQGDYFDKDIANQNNLEGYYVVEIDDFVYNPRISQSAPVGPLKRNNLAIGVMSPLYTILSCKKGNLDFFENYFNSNFWHKYMKGIANYGVRHDRMNITKDGFEKLPLPFPEVKEQEKIAAFLNEIDKQIQAVTSQLKQTKKFKKGVLQQMFV